MIDKQVNGAKNNCLILGAGRSGTSLTALLLARAGYHVCSRSNPADEGNPFGYFEDLDVIATNEAILKSTYRSARQRFSRALEHKPNISRPGAWLLDLDYRRLRDVHLGSAHEKKFRKFFARAPFAYKDPRFSFTLGALARLIPANTGYICIFRHPLPTVSSTKKHALRNRVALDDRYCLDVWEAHYRCLLEQQRQVGGRWLFVSYETLIGGNAISRMEEFLNVQLDHGLVKRDLSRCQADGVVPKQVLELFEMLKEREAIGIDANALKVKGGLL